MHRIPPAKLFSVFLEYRLEDGVRARGRDSIAESYAVPTSIERAKYG